MTDIASNLNYLRRDIESTALRCGRAPKSIKLLAVSKTFSHECVRKAHEVGQLLFGENRVQEAKTKVALVKQTEIKWHLIGPLQSNKTSTAVEIFDSIQTLDRPKIVHKVNQCSARIGKFMDVFIEVNIGKESQKSGVLPEETKELIRLVDSMSNLQLVGLMAVPPYNQDPVRSRPYFQKLRGLLSEVNQYRSSPLLELSMGMTHDYHVAIEEGATVLRIGTAVFGRRG